MWTIGQKKEFGTYNANVIFDENGQAILMVYGIASNFTLEELNEQDTEGLAIARQVVNDHNGIPALRNAGEKMAEILRKDLEQFGASSEIFYAVQAWEAANK